MRWNKSPNLSHFRIPGVTSLSHRPISETTRDIYARSTVGDMETFMRRKLEGNKPAHSLSCCIDGSCRVGREILFRKESGSVVHQYLPRTSLTCPSPQSD
ncbi:hypothetical protein AVEN_218564-1 [Araneus ventricosus]|uniref:Uncharacterized protein n=1 Tax=Araneus ventricosus TaxID=182803 RepID=A0A4Y2VJJ8_ARAVE|nr:hypothetical protein AVEN_218564-1 [Araneus ventricosus]